MRYRGCLRPVSTFVLWPARIRSFTASHGWLESKQLKSAEDIKEYLSRPTWSVASLLPKDSTAVEAPTITRKQLHHLLRLSALPPPADQAEEDQMLQTLASQLHFVKEIQSVDTTGLEPLYSLRDETKSGREEATIGLEKLKDALAQEEVVGQYHKRLRRKRVAAGEQQHAQWDVLGTAEKKVGRYFVVEGGKD